MTHAVIVTAMVQGTGVLWRESEFLVWLKRETKPHSCILLAKHLPTEEGCGLSV